MNVLEAAELGLQVGIVGGILFLLWLQVFDWVVELRELRAGRRRRRELRKSVAERLDALGAAAWVYEGDDGSPLFALDAACSAWKVASIRRRSGLYEESEFASEVLGVWEDEYERRRAALVWKGLQS